MAKEKMTTQIEISIIYIRNIEISHLKIKTISAQNWTVLREETACLYFWQIG